jgi:hypothetical protein
MFRFAAVVRLQSEVRGRISTPVSGHYRYLHRFAQHLVRKHAIPGKPDMALLQSNHQNRDKMKRDKSEFDTRTNARILFIIPTR